MGGPPKKKFSSAPPHVIFPGIALSRKIWKVCLNFSGEIIDTDCDEKGQSTKYKLIGVVVHSGQASGGHYYSYILHRPEGQVPKWYKFDDGDVSECKMEDDEVFRMNTSIS